MIRSLTYTPKLPPVSASQWFELVGSPCGWVGSDIVSGAVYYNGKTYFGFIDLNSAARVATYDHASGHVAISPAVVATNLVADVHCTPSVMIRASDHRLVLAVAPHDNVPSVHLYVAVSTNPQDISSWNAPTDIASGLGGTSYTYAKLIQLSGESGRIYLFYRDEQNTGATSALCYSTSTDGGATWSAQTTLYKQANAQSYWVIETDDTSRIDFAVSDGTAFYAQPSSLYHFYYQSGSFYKTDGTLITTTPPFSPSDLTKVYDSSNGYVRVPYSIAGGSSPAIGWAAWDASGSGANEKYWYGVWSGGAWHVNAVLDQGAPQTAYFSDGGIAIDKTSPNTVYVARLIASNWQIIKAVTSDNGASWTTTRLTNDTGLVGDTYNLRPISPHNAVGGLKVAWSFGPHFLNGGAVAGHTLEQASAQVRGYPNPIGPM